MKRTRTVAAGFVVLAVLSGFAALASSAPARAGKSSGDKIARGKYLVTAMGCNDCHTPGTFYGAPDMTRMLAGSELGWEGPWGVVFAANLTPDLDTGLGYWSADELVKVFRTGNRPDGRQLTPAMPWLNLSHMTDEDLYAIAAYLQSIPAVKHAEPQPVPPGKAYDGPVIRFPPPPAWDAPRTRPAGAHE
jgi:mono/diheme cytochrome c family protein